jgi:hypothetical protein
MEHKRESEHLVGGMMRIHCDGYWVPSAESVRQKSVTVWIETKLFTRNPLTGCPLLQSINRHNILLIEPTHRDAFNDVCGVSYC